MKLSEIKEHWTFTPNIGATSYWFEETDDGTGGTIGPVEVLEIGCQLEAKNEKTSNALAAAQVFAIELKAENQLLRFGIADVRDSIDDRTHGATLSECEDWYSGLDALLTSEESEG